MVAPVSQFKLVFESVNCNGIPEQRKAKFSQQRNCFGMHCSFGTLLKMHKREIPDHAYLIARIEDVNGSVDFYDGVRTIGTFTRSCKLFDLLHTDVAVHSVTFFEHVVTEGNTHTFRQVACCKRVKAIANNQFLQVYTQRIGEQKLLERLQNPENYKELCKLCLQATSETATAEVVKVLVQLSDMYYRGTNVTKDPSFTMKLLEKVLELDPDNAIAICNIGAIYYESQDVSLRDLAKEWLTLAITIEPDFDVAYFYLGKIALEEGNVQEAQKNLEEAYAIRSTNHEAALLLANLVKDTNPARARDITKGVLKKESQNTEALALMLSLQTL